MDQGTEANAARWPGPGDPGDGRAEVWIADLDAIAAEPALLDTEERARAARMATPDLQRRYAVTRTILKRLLCAYLDAAPEDLRFASGPQGKPRLVGSGALRFNLTHSQGRAAFAFTCAGEIGVDVEVIRPLANMEGMARRCLSACELRRWQGIAEEERAAAFFRAWTRKEAVLKALGVGVSGGLANVEVGFGTEKPLAVVGLGGPVSGSGPWSLCEIDLPAGAMGALAVSAAGVVVDHLEVAAAGP